MVRLTAARTLRRSILLFSVLGASACGVESSESLGTTEDPLVPVCVTIRRGETGDVSDLFLSGDYPTWNTGNQQSLYVGVSSGGNINTALYGFDLSSVPGSATVTSAVFRPYVSWNADNNLVFAHRVLGPWSEATTTAENFNMANIDPAAEGSFLAGGVGLKSVNLTALVNGWVNGTIANHGIALQESPVASHHIFPSEVSLNLRPRLELCYTAGTCSDGTLNQGELGVDCGGPCDPCFCSPSQTLECYSGPAGTAGVGPCAAGTQTCNAQGSAFGPCVGDVTPVAESCATAGDDDCDGQTNEGCVCQPNASVACYSGPAGTAGVGVCAAGLKTCNAQGSAFGPCVGEVTPVVESCATAGDDDCDGRANDGCVCQPNSSQSCYTGAAGTAGVGLCAAGTRTCNAQGSAYGACTGEVTPVVESCATVGDDDCDGQTNEGCVCAPGSSTSCYTGPAGTQNVGICKAGTKTCNAQGTAYGACNGEVKPGSEACNNGTDDDCDGTVNDGCAGATCALYSENFDDGNATELTAGAYKVGWCDTTIPTAINTPLCMSGRTLRTNMSSEDPTIWVSRGAATCTSVKISYSYYQFAASAVTLRYQTSNDATEVCEKAGSFTALATYPSLQACMSQTHTIPFNSSSGMYIRFDHDAGSNALWLDNISIELLGCSC